jgi:hypothetical protein
MANKLFRTYYNEKTESSTLPDSSKILIQNGTDEPTKINPTLITASINSRVTFGSARFKGSISDIANLDTATLAGGLYFLLRLDQSTTYYFIVAKFNQTVRATDLLNGLIYVPFFNEKFSFTTRGSSANNLFDIFTMTVASTDAMTSNSLYPFDARFQVSSDSSGGGGGTVDVVSNVATNTILGRIAAGSGDSQELTPAQVRTLIGVEYITYLTVATAGAEQGKLDGSNLAINRYNWRAPSTQNVFTVENKTAGAVIQLRVNTAATTATFTIDGADLTGRLSGVENWFPSQIMDIEIQVLDDLSLEVAFQTKSY